MTRTILIACISAAGLGAIVAACADRRPMPPAIGVCEALRPDLPVKYHASTTDLETIGNIRRGNARFREVCPEFNG